jgi:hypothetical protein
LSSPQQFLYENQKENNEIDENTLLNLVGRDCGTDNTGAGEVSMAESGNFLLCQGRAGVWVFHPLLKLSTLEQIAALSPLQVDWRSEQ